MFVIITVTQRTCVLGFFRTGISLTFNSVSYDSLGKVSDRTPGVPIISAAYVAEMGYILPRHQLIGL